MRLEGVDVMGWLDDPSAVFVMDEQSRAQSAPQPSTLAEPRMIFHNGKLHLRTPDPQKTLDSATQLALSLGGYVESRQPTYAIFRIPADTFRVSFPLFQSLGQVQSKSMNSDDITAAFQEADLHLKIAEATLLRLQQILAETTHPTERIELLKRIEQVSQQIEIKKLEKEKLGRMAQYGHLSLAVDPLLLNQGIETIGAFLWMQNLSPTRSQETTCGNEYLELSAPQGMVALPDPRHWYNQCEDPCRKDHTVCAESSI